VKNDPLERDLRCAEQIALAPKLSCTQSDRASPLPQKTVEQIEHRNSLIYKAFFEQFCSCSFLPIERGLFEDKF
jgi:hypothetical protein